MIRSPFIRHEGHWYVIEDWERGVRNNEPLTLRPLTNDEVAVIEGYRENFDAEARAVIVGGK